MVGECKGCGREILDFSVDVEVLGEGEVWSVGARDFHHDGCCGCFTVGCSLTCSFSV